MDVASTALFVGKPTPTGFRIGHKISQHHHPLWERACPRRGPVCRRKSHSKSADSAYNWIRPNWLARVEARLYFVVQTYSHGASQHEYITYAESDDQDW